MTIRLATFKSENTGERGSEQGMAAVGEIPARDLEFEALLRNAAEVQKLELGCKLRGEAI